MYANFLYFIVALLILLLYQPVDQPRLPLGQTLLIFVGIIFLFSFYTRTVFFLLIRRTQSISRRMRDQLYSRLVTRQSILAMVLFAIDIWVLDLPSYLRLLPVFSALPTLSDLTFLLVFVGYLVIIWHTGFSTQQAIYETDFSLWSYIYSNLAFSLPILIPYALLSGIMDLILLLPFELPKQIINTSLGQTGYFLIFLFIAALFAPLMIQKFWRCYPLEAGPIRHRIEALCRASGVNYRNIVYWPIFKGRMITAGVMGLASRFRYILVTKALLQLLNIEEIEQVIAHEIGHVKRRHLVLYLFFFIGFMLVSYTISIVSYYLIFLNPAVIKLMINWKFEPDFSFKIISSVLLILGVIFYFRFLFGYFMRNFERQADGYVFHLFPTAQPLINTFGKIVTTSGQHADKPNWHHFSIRQRVDYLKKCEESPNQTVLHDRKMRKSIFLYLAGLILLAMSVFQFNQYIGNQTNRRVALGTLEAYLEHKQGKAPQDALLYLLVGNMHFELQQLDRAAQAYENGLMLNPDQSDILNNLAWLLATGKDSGLFDPVRALALAHRAIELKKAPHIYDTLAECYFANGRFQEAVAVEHKALNMNPDDREIYEAQLRKFNKALENSNRNP